MNPKEVNSQALRNYLMTLDSAYYQDGESTNTTFQLSKPYYDAHSVLAGGYVPLIPKHVQDPQSLTDKISWPDIHNVSSSNPAVQEFATWFEKPELGRDPKFQIGSGQ